MINDWIDVLRGRRRAREIPIRSQLLALLGLAVYLIIAVLFIVAVVTAEAQGCDLYADQCQWMGAHAMMTAWPSVDSL